MSIVQANDAPSRLVEAMESIEKKRSETRSLLCDLLSSLEYKTVHKILTWSVKNAQSTIAAQDGLVSAERKRLGIEISGHAEPMEESPGIGGHPLEILSIETFYKYGTREV